ncbi:hypothetical protein EHF33_19925 (plasmid) [Deinococcus psychrotolerans]|uniref:Orc1-like AAA ATPase domain-containing protein n=1 Tax=Deinococcus psychrotolerans TaxID=2489213 RepID=A0A3G8YJP5_9DEIO|nr:hypothetical protein EHF33_19925 [Deinococcus psychrotolerans]
MISRLAEEALQRGFAVSQVSMNRDKASLHLLERLYQGIMQQVQLRGTEGNALGTILDRWISSAEEYVTEVQGIPEHLETAVREAVGQRIEVLLGEVARERPSYSAALKTYHQAHMKGNHALKRDVLGWLMADPHASTRQLLGVRGQVQASDTLAYLRELTRMLRQLKRPGLLIILDELDEMRHLRRDLRQRAWANLRDLLDALGRGIPGLYLVLAGTPEVYDDRRGISELPPLDQRLGDPTQQTQHPNLRGPQLPLPVFSQAQLTNVMARLEQLWSVACEQEARLPVGFAASLAEGWTQRLGSRSPRVAIREFISVLDRTRDYPDFSPLHEYSYALDPAILTPQEAEVPVLVDDEDLF